MGSHIFFFNNSSRPLLLVKLSRSCYYMQIKSKTYSVSGMGRKSDNKGNGHEILIEQERASSTADEFKKVAEEKVKMAAEKGGKNQLGVKKAEEKVRIATERGVEKTIDATGEGEAEAVKKTSSRHEGGAN